jgi:predicted NAD/FAD-dependent oxidoreductase
MRIAVVGAGLSGLAAAREARGRGHEVVVFEKSRGVGGRVASRRVEGTVVDHGSPAISAPAESSLADALQPLAGADTHRVAEGVADTAGAAAPLKALAAGLDVRRAVRLRALRPSSAGYELADEQGNAHGVADAVIVSAPAPQAADLLAESGEPGERVAALRSLPYLPAVMVLAGVRTALPGGPCAPAGGSPLAALRVETDKGRVPLDGLAPVVGRLTDRLARELLDSSDEVVLARALPALADALGAAAADPGWVQVKRWRYAVPEGHLDARALNPAGARIVLAGDSLTGAAFGAADHGAVFASGIVAVAVAEAAVRSRA